MIAARARRAAAARASAGDDDPEHDFNLCLSSMWTVADCSSGHHDISPITHPLGTKVIAVSRLAV